MKNAIIYLRVSTDTQDMSIKSQLSLCHEYAQLHGYTIKNVYRDREISGDVHFEQRQGLSEAIKDIKKEETLLLAKRDRLSRDVVVMGRIEYEIVHKKKGFIVSAWPSEQNKDMLMLRILDVFAEHEKNIIRERIKRGMAAKRERNEWLGSTPVDKKVSKDGVHLEKDDEAIKVIRRIKMMNKKGISIRKIATILNEKGILNRQRPWTRESVYTRIKVKL